MRFHWISPVFLGFAILALVSCDSPSPRMMRAERHETVVDGSQFTVYRGGDSVEIYRTSPEVLPHLSEVMAKASLAVKRTTGCAVKPGSMQGDAALMTAQLDCG